MADFTDEFIENVNVLHPSEHPKIALEITHPNILEPLRIINDNCDLIIGGETFIAFDFELNFFDDVENELTKASIKVQNVGRELVKWIESSLGAKDAIIKIMFVRRADPDEDKIIIPSQVSRTVITTKDITFDLIIAKNNFTQRGTRFTFSVEKAPGAF